MSLDESEQGSKNLVNEIIYAPEEQSYLKELRNEWSSLEPLIQEETNNNKKYDDEELYSPRSGEVCATKCLSISNSSVSKHIIFYKYPSVSDPGIKDALILPKCPVILP